ncbi:MAG: asparaginase [Defluviitaleaceae bacterium]|nr:asparaginase [Defluviitaleaceae bacterium]
MKKIALLIAGGTISMEDTGGGGADIAKSNPFEQFGDVSQEKIFNPLLPSPHITQHEMLEIRKAVIRKIEQGFEGVIVTHGTDILEETAYFLDLTIEANVPVVLIGAMRSMDNKGYDGVYNLEAAIKVASSPEAVGMGVLVVMNDEIHAARNVTKTHASNVATFQSPQAGPMGVVTAGGVRMNQRPFSNHRRYPLETITKNVILLKAFAGMDSQIFDALDSAGVAVDGFVVEGFGSGNLPPGTLSGLRKFLDKGIPVVLVSRCLSGNPGPVYKYMGGGAHLEELGVIFSFGLNGPKARLKLIAALEAALSRDEMVAEFRM